MLHKQEPPRELYDLGLRFAEFPDYFPNKKPYKQQRDIIKKFMNALINDEQGKHRLSDANAKFLGESSRLTLLGFGLVLARSLVLWKALEFDRITCANDG